MRPPTRQVAAPVVPMILVALAVAIIVTTAFVVAIPKANAARETTARERAAGAVAGPCGRYAVLGRQSEAGDHPSRADLRALLAELVDAFEGAGRLHRDWAAGRDAAARYHALLAVPPHEADPAALSSAARAVGTACARR